MSLSKTVKILKNQSDTVLYDGFYNIGKHLNNCKTILTRNPFDIPEEEDEDILKDYYVGDKKEIKLNCLKLLSKLDLFIDGSFNKLKKRWKNMTCDPDPNYVETITNNVSTYKYEINKLRILLSRV